MPLDAISIRIAMAQSGMATIRPTRALVDELLLNLLLEQTLGQLLRRSLPMSLAVADEISSMVADKMAGPVGISAPPGRTLPARGVA